MSEVKVSSLHTYPIKSCAGIELDTALITPTGLEYDRNFMVIDPEGSFLSQRQIPEMALITPQIENGVMTVSAPGISDLEVPLAPQRKRRSIMKGTVHGKDAWGQLVGSEADEWFTEFLPPYKDIDSYRFLRIATHLPRLIKQTYRDCTASNKVGFADGYPFLLISDVSLDQLNEHLDEPAPVNRFRPNIVVTGDNLEPYEEDTWREIRIGSLSAFVIKACDRCVIPDIDQTTAETSKTVRKALAQTRRGANRYDQTKKGVFFGQNLNHIYTEENSVAVGDAIQVTVRSPEPNVIIK